MAVTKKSVNGAFYFTYPSSDVFLKDRNYFIFEGVEDDTYINTVKIGDKTLNFGRYALSVGSKFYLDVSAYYAKYYGNFNVVITYENYLEEVVTNTTAINATTYDCYSPFLEFVPERCSDAPYARIVPPNRMLWDGKKSTTSMLAAVRDDDYFSGYEYEMEGVPYETYRPSDAWLTNAQKNAHLGETYRNTLKATGNLAELDSNGLPLWIEQGNVYAIPDNIGKTFEQLRMPENVIVRTKTIFENYNGLTISAPPAGLYMLICLYDKNKKLASSIGRTQQSVTLNNADTYKYFSINYSKQNYERITPSELVGIASSALTNPDAGKSYRWAYYLGKFQWVELTKEQIINNKFYWSVNSKNYSGDIVNNDFTFDKTFEARLVRAHNISPIYNEYFTVQSVNRFVSLANGSLPYVYIRWRTPWGITVEHLFYLGSYSSDKADANELESVNYYEELSKHVRVGSFYLDGITQPYDLFYYKTLENAELVEMYFPSYAFKHATYMPNGDTYVAVKITGSNIKDAVVDGVAQSTITFDFEMR